MSDNHSARSIPRCIWFRFGYQIRSVLEDRLDIHEKNCRHRSNKCPFGCILRGLEHSEVREHIKQCSKRARAFCPKPNADSLDWESIPPDTGKNVRERQRRLIRRVNKDLEGYRLWQKRSLKEERTPNHQGLDGVDSENKRKKKDGTQFLPAQLDRPLLNGQTFAGNFRPGQPRCLSCLQRSLPANSTVCPSLTCDLTGASFALPSFMHRHMANCFKGLPSRCSRCAPPSGYLAHDPSLTTSATIPSGSNIESFDSSAVPLTKWPETARNNAQIQRAGFGGKEITTSTSAGPGLWPNTKGRALQPEERLNEVIIPRKILTIEEMCNTVLTSQAR